MSEEWEIVATVPHPEPGLDGGYPVMRADGLTEERAKELARGRNRAGEPSPAVTWTAQEAQR